MEKVFQSKFRPGRTHKSINTFERNYIKIQTQGIIKKQIIDTYFEFSKYYLEISSQFQIGISEEFIKAVLDKSDDYKNFVYEKYYYNPELIPQQFFLFIQKKMSELGRKITDYYSSPIAVEYLSDQVVGFKIEDVEWRVKV